MKKPKPQISQGLAQVVIPQDNTGSGYRTRGDCLELITSEEQEVILAGPADVGKSVAACLKAHLICCMIPKVQGAIVRKTYTSMPGSILMSFWKIAEPQGIVCIGGQYPTKYLYPNGSVIWVGGMDNPDRVLSSERDFIYTCQTEEFTESEWETLATRCSGRSAVIAKPQLFGDCNPGGSRHWIKLRAQRGTLRLLQGQHRDNPTLFDDNGRLINSDQVRRRMAVLDALTGVRRLRLRDGIWATAEGAVFDTFNANRTGAISDHVQERGTADIRNWYLCQDHGYNNPAALLLVGEDGDDHWHVFREFYGSGILEMDMVATAKLWNNFPLAAAGKNTKEELQLLQRAEDNLRRLQQPVTERPRCQLDAVDDASPGLIAALQAAGVNAKGGKGKILDGVHAIQNRFAVGGDGRPRLSIDPDCINLINELESHVWDTKGTSQKDTPKDCDNHAIAALRYLVDVKAEPSGAIGPQHAGSLATGKPEDMGPRSVKVRPWPGRF